MKKSISVILILVLLLMSAVPVAQAQTDSGKISPELSALIDANPEGGAVVEIFHHDPAYPTDGVTQEVAYYAQDHPKYSLTEAERIAVENNQKAHAALIAKIGEISYMEPDGFSIGRCYVGLPYSSIEAVAALDNVDYIDIPRDYGSTLSAREKYSDMMRDALWIYSSDSYVRLELKLSYNAHLYIGTPSPGIDCTREEIDAYIKATSDAQHSYYLKKNSEYADAVCAAADVKIKEIHSEVAYLTIETRISEVEKIASMEEVAFVIFSRYVNKSNHSDKIYAERFEEWMRDQGFESVDYSLSKIDPGYSYWSETYEDYDNFVWGRYDNYDELYSSDEWGLVYATVNEYELWEVIEHMCLGNRVISWHSHGAAVYPYGYFVYSAAEDTFYPIERFVVEPVISVDDYSGLFDVLDELKIGVLRGDADRDDMVTILDATATQRFKAGLISEVGLDVAAADTDGDGETTILDATRTQRYLVGLCDMDGEEMHG